MELSLLMGMMSVSTVVMIIDHGDRKNIKDYINASKRLPMI